jgi:predicted ATP-dependent serine protease
MCFNLPFAHFSCADLKNEELYVADAADEKTEFVRAQATDSAGLSKDMEVFLFVRPAVRKINEVLDKAATDQGTNIVRFQGPPGAGKSMSVWYWACNKAQAGFHVFWVHLKDNHGLLAKAVELKQGQLLAVGELEQEELLVRIRESEADIVIIDGHSKDSQKVAKKAEHWMKNKEGHRLVVEVSSE